jgi:hypothetical protein
MIGFYNPCGRGKDVESWSTEKVEEAFSALKKTEQWMSKHDEDEYKKDEEDKEKCKLRPIHRPKHWLSKTKEKLEEKYKDDPEKLANAKKAAHQESDVREKGYVMWQEDSVNPVKGIVDYINPNESKENEDIAPFFKIKNGDIIKIKELLELVGPEAGLDYPKRNNRYDGMVIVIDIHYSNWKEYTWPNRFPSAYFYSFSLAPADEFKLMQDQTRQVVQERHGEHMRVLNDYHGIFIYIRQHGDVSVWSWWRILLLLLGGLVLNSLYISLFTCCILNSPQWLLCSKDPEEDVQDEELELQDLIAKDFEIGTENPGRKSTRKSTQKRNSTEEIKPQSSGGYEPLASKQ